MDMNINPELLLFWAPKAYPGKDWCRPLLPGHPDYGDGRETEADYVAYFDYDGPEDREIRFNPLTSSDDREALMLALSKPENGWWVFCPSAWAENAKQTKYIEDESFPMLLLKVASAQSGLSLYVENVHVK